MRRVVVTGLGMVTPLACGVESTWRRLINGESGARRVATFDVSDLASKIACQVPSGNGADDTFDPDLWVAPKEQRKVVDFIIFAMGAAHQALDDAAWTPSTHEDRIRTVSTAVGSCGRQVNVFFRLGPPTETDEGVLEIAHMAHRVIRAGREASGSKDIRCTISIGTQYAGMSVAEITTVRRRVRDSGGAPTGFLIEEPAMSLVRKLLPPVSRETLVQGLKQFSGVLASLGITATTEPGATPDEIGAYMEVWRQQAMKHRVRIMQRVFGAADVKARSAVIAPNFGDEFLRIGGFKSLFDGGVEGRFMSEPYRSVVGEQNDPNVRGTLLLTPGVDAAALAMFSLAT